MAYSAEVMARARAKLAQAKEDRASENRQHLAQAYAAVPRIREIDIQLRATMALAAQAAFSQGENPQQRLQEAQKKNLLLQQERAELALQHFPQGYLDETPICVHCGGNGYVGSTMCTCLQELCRQEQQKELVLLSGNGGSFAQFELSYYPETVDSRYGISPRSLMEKNLRTCKKYASNFTKDSGNLLFVGGTGLGKTFLSACIAGVVAEKGYSVVYETAANLFSKLEQARFNATEENRQEVARLAACDLLIVDDLGTELPGQFVTAALYSLMNDRILSGKPMLISTNLNVDEAAKRYSPQIASRLQGNFVLLPFMGEDIRVLKNRGL